MSRFLKAVVNQMPGEGKKEPEGIASKLANYQDSIIATEASKLAQDASSVAQDASKLAEGASLLAKSDDEKHESASNIAIYNASNLANQSISQPLLQHSLKPSSGEGKTQLNTRIPLELYDEMLEAAALISATIQEAVTEALVDFVHKYTGKKLANYSASNLASYPSAPIKELSKLEIIFLYSQISKKSVGIRDRKLIDKALKAYHPLLVELGIRKGDIIARESGGLVYSFNYCMVQISAHADWELSAIAKELVTFR